MATLLKHMLCFWLSEPFGKQSKALQNKKLMHSIVASGRLKTKSRRHTVSMECPSQWSQDPRTLQIRFKAFSGTQPFLRLLVEYGLTRRSIRNTAIRVFEYGYSEYARIRANTAQYSPSINALIRRKICDQV